MAFRTITKANAPGYAETEWRMWLAQPDPRALTMLPLVECVRSSEPERIAGLARHLAALSEDVRPGQGMALDCDAFRAFVDTVCEEAMGFARCFGPSAIQEPWPPGAPSAVAARGGTTTSAVTVLSTEVRADVAQRFYYEAWGDQQGRLAAARNQLLSSHRRLLDDPAVGALVHPPHVDFRLHENFLYRSLPDGRIHVARVLHDVGWFAYQLF